MKSLNLTIAMAFAMLLVVSCGSQESRPESQYSVSARQSAQKSAVYLSDDDNDEAADPVPVTGGP